MEIIIGKTSGFCGGVLNAVTKTEKELNKEKGTIYCLGELVHNKQVIEKLEKKGLKTIENINDAKEKTIIRAHGVPKEIYKRATEKGIELIDLTCPKVLDIHRTVEQYAKNGFYVLLVGVEKHPEVIGTISFGEGNAFLIKEKEDITEAIEKVDNSQLKKVLVIAQTTYSLKKFEDIAQQLQEKLGNKYEIEIKNTICSATRLRQEETEELSKISEAMIIVGGKNSSNTKKLYEIAKANCQNTILVETVDDIDINKMKRHNKIGIMAGASTPNESVEKIKEKLIKE
ncbi:MAG: 4-hydroxy-3-methylbut-2-enyl diphosphate reductase [Clostridia bacterium]|nr:4-hydroxy-3-methylbut-2-enyl diphosphate reductase [Clostridia bacterium]